MGDFIANSEVSKNALNMANLASTLPVQVLIFGEIGTGKRSLANVVAPESNRYDALVLQEQIREGIFKLDDIESVIITDIHRITNIKQFIEKLEEHNIKVVATATEEKESFGEKFAVRIDLLPLIQRPADMKVLSESYLQEANKLFGSSVHINDITLDVARNAHSLKESIYRGVLFDSVDRDQVLGLLEKFLYRQMDIQTEYKDLLEIFEIPLINAAREKYRSQLQMASKLNINRNTLRKKINQYNLSED